MVIERPDDLSVSPKRDIFLEDSGSGKTSSHEGLPGSGRKYVSIRENSMEDTKYLK